LPKLTLNCPPPPKMLKLVMGERLGCTLTNEKPTGISTLGTSWAQIVAANKILINNSRDFFFISVSPYGFTVDPASNPVATGATQHREMEFMAAALAPWIVADHARLENCGCRFTIRIKHGRVYWYCQSLQALARRHLSSTKVVGEQSAAQSGFCAIVVFGVMVAIYRETAICAGCEVATTIIVVGISSQQF